MKLEGLVHATICYPLDARKRALMGVKTRTIGVGLLNGAGGEVEDGETIDAATIRETLEETGLAIDPRYLERHAVIYFHNYKKDGSYFHCKGFVSLAPRWSGAPRPGEDGGLVDLRWVSPEELPLGQMMPGDRDWVPRVLRGERLIGEVWYAPGMRSLERRSRIVPCTERELDRSWVKP